MMNLTPHEAEVAALVLREHASEMDAEAAVWNRGQSRIAPQPERSVVQSIRTRQLREIADKLEGALV